MAPGSSGPSVCLACGPSSRHAFPPRLRSRSYSDAPPPTDLRAAPETRPSRRDCAACGWCAKPGLAPALHESSRPPSNHHLNPFSSRCVGGDALYTRPMSRAPNSRARTQSCVPRHRCRGDQNAAGACVVHPIALERNVQRPICWHISGTARELFRPVIASGACSSPGRSGRGRLLRRAIRCAPGGGGGTSLQCLHAM